MLKRAVVVMTLAGSVLFAQVPAAPTGLTATAGNAVVSLTWQPSSGATNYRVKRSTTGPNGTYSVMANPVGTSFGDSLVTNGSTYWYMVSAINASGQSANSSKVSAVPNAPGGINLCNGVVPAPGQTLSFTSNNCWTATTPPASGVNILLNGVSIGQASSLDLSAFSAAPPGAVSGIAWACLPPGTNGLVQCYQGVNTALVTTLQTLEQGKCKAVTSSNGTSAYVFSFAGVPGCTALTAYGPAIYAFTPDVANVSGAASLKIDGIGIVNIKQVDGFTDPVPNQLQPGQTVLIQYDGKVFRIIAMTTVQQQPIAGVSNCTGLYKVAYQDGSNTTIVGVSMPVPVNAKQTWTTLPTVPVQVATCSQ